MKKDEPRKPIAEKFLNNAETHIKTIVIIFVATIIFAPLIIKHCVCTTVNISAETMVSYIGNALSSLATFFAAVIALFIGQRSSTMQERIFFFERRDKIRPYFCLTVKKNQNKTYNLTLKNISENFAKDIYLYDGVIISDFIDKQKEKKFCISFDDEKIKGVPHIVNSDCYDLENDYPKEIVVGFSDIDNNDIQQVFKREAENIYVAADFIYL